MAARAQKQPASPEPDTNDSVLVPGGDRPRAHGGDAEQQILAATERLLATTPLTKLSVARIVEEAGVSRTTFYFYFSSKHAPISALLTQVMDEIYGSVSAFTDRGDGDDGIGDGFAALDRGLEGAAQVFRDHRMVLRAVVENWRLVPELRKLWLGIIERFTTAFAAEIDRERARGNAPAGIPSRELAAGLIWGCERVLYVAGLGLDHDIPNEDRALRTLQTMWKATVYGGVQT